MNRAFDCCRMNFIMRDRNTGSDSALQSFVKIDNHDNAGFNGNSEQCDISNPDRDAEVVAQCPLQNQTASERVDSRKDQHRSFCNRVEDHIQQHKDDEEHDRQDDLQTCFCSLLKLVLASPAICVASRQAELVIKQALGFLNE